MCKMLSATITPVLPEKYIKKQEQPNFRPAAPAIKGRIESRKQEHVGDLTLSTPFIILVNCEHSVYILQQY